MNGGSATQNTSATRTRWEEQVARDRQAPRARRRLVQPALASILALGLLIASVIQPAAAAALSGSNQPGRLSGVSHQAAPVAASDPDARPADSGLLGDVSPLAVIGPDDRTRTVTDAFPMSAIAYLELSFTAYDSQCTGTFVGPNVLLTAAHCLYSQEDGWVEQIRVVPGKDGHFEPFGSAYADWFWIPDGWYYGYEGYYDWGLVRLPTSDLAYAAGWFQIGVLSTSSLASPDFYPVISGYPGDKPLGTQWFGTQPAFDSVSDVGLEYTIDTYGGMSGSSIWRAADRLIVGIHTSGYYDVNGDGLYNAGRRVDQFLLNDLLDGCAQIGCEFAYAIEGPPSAGEYLYGSTLAEWGTGSHAGGTSYIGQDGSYRMQVGPGNGSYTMASTDFGGYTNVIVSVDVRLTSQAGDAYGCLMTRLGPGGSYDYALCIDAYGNLGAIYEYFDESGYYHVVPLSHGVLVSDRPAHEWNRLTIVAYGNDFWFFVNDAFVGIATHAGPLEGAIGMTVVNYADQPVEFAFTNLEIWSAY